MGLYRPKPVVIEAEQFEGAADPETQWPVGLDDRNSCLRAGRDCQVNGQAEREMTGLHTFGWAIKQMQNGGLVQRQGWNGKGMYLYLDRGAIRTHLTVAGAAGAVSYEPCIVMFTAQGRHQPGWLASQADMLAADWRIVEPGETARVVEAHDGCRNPAHGTPG